MGTSNFGEKADRHTTYASGREKMAKTRGAAGPTAGVPARKVSKENLGGVTRVLKAKNTNVAAAGAVKKTSKSNALVAVENLTQQTRGLRLEQFGNKENVLKKCARTAGTSKKTKSKAKALVEEETPVLVPADLLPAGVDDIDEDEDPQVVSDNVKHIYAYLRQMEDRLAIPKDFLRNSTITPRMRAILINWLAQVALQFKLLPETLYLTVEIIDRYLSVPGQLQYKSLQLVGVSAMWIACKYEEMFMPDVNDFVFITDQAYDTKMICAKELDILKALNFNIGKPIALNFLRRNSKAGYVGVRHHSLAKYILEESFTNYPLACVKPSEKASAALLISLKILDPEMSLQDLWSSNLTFYSGYALSDLMSTAAALAKCLLQAPHSKYTAAYDKYNTASKSHVARLPSLHEEMLKSFTTES